MAGRVDELAALPAAMPLHCGSWHPSVKGGQSGVGGDGRPGRSVSAFGNQSACLLNAICQICPQSACVQSAEHLSAARDNGVQLHYTDDKATRAVVRNHDSQKL